MKTEVFVLLAIVLVCSHLNDAGSYLVARLLGPVCDEVSLGTRKIGLKDVRELQPGGVIWDAAVPSFGARRQRGAAVAYVLKYRTIEGRQRWYTIGRHGAPWTPDMAREEARRLLGEVVRGGDPAADKSAKRNALTVAELCDQYLADVSSGRVLTRRKAPKKLSTLTTDKVRIERHIKPHLGRVAVNAVTRDDIEKFMHDVAAGKAAAKGGPGLTASQATGGKGAATRTVGLLGAIFTYAVRRRICAENPVRGIIRYADGRRERRLSEAEYAALGRGLADGFTAGIWPPAIHAARFLALTGWRSGEAIGLKWADIDFVRRTATLSETKTGRSIRPLSRQACELLKAITRAGDLVFPASRGVGRMLGFPKIFVRLAKMSGIPADVTPHVLRHSFASTAADLGYSELTIATLLGHKGHSVTAGYVHSADTVILAAADAVASHIAGQLGDPRPTGEVIQLRAKEA